MNAKLLVIAVLAFCLMGCSQRPECSSSTGDMTAPSAGCLVVSDGDLLLVKSMGGFYGPPGGSVDRRESAQCGAERETWEETGVIAKAGELAVEFDNGFHLYWCESLSGRAIDISRPLEIKHADWFDPELFQHLKWRYRGQGEAIEKLMASR
jgi:8-oxo-dGTP pyrophosphatase MutT (NUDIX family)